MNTVIMSELMLSEQRENPSLLSINQRSEFGQYLIINTASRQSGFGYDYPGWRQIRRHGSRILDVMGTGNSPSQDVIKIWATIDANFTCFTAICIESIRKLIAKSADDYDQLLIESIDESIYNNNIYISELLFGDSSQLSVNLDYPGSDTFYIWPQIEFHDMNIVRIELVP